MILRDWLELLPGKLAWIARFRAPRRRPARRRLRPQRTIDALEPRVLLSATAVDDDLVIHIAPGDSAIPLPIRDNDLDATSSTVTLVGATNDQIVGDFGTVEISGGLLQYTPSATVDASFQFQYQLDGASTATVTATPNHVPTGQADNYSTGPGETVALNVLANDSDPEGHELSIQSFNDPANGTVVEVPDVSESTWNYWLDSGQNYYSNFADWYNSYYNYYGSSPLTYKYEYTPDPGFSGDDTFSYTVVDSQGATTTASVTVSVAPNQAPVTTDDAYSVLPGESVTLDVLANDSDPEGHAISIQSFDEPANGTVAEVPDVSESTWNYWLDSGQNYYSNFADWYNSYYNYYGSSPLTYKYEYTPDAGFSGDDTFNYTVIDSQGATTTASVTVSVAPNQAPVTTDDSYSVLPGESVTLNVLANDSDPEGHAISIQSFDEPANGTVAEVPDVSESTWNYWLDSGQNYYSNFADWYNSYYNYYGSTPLTYKYEYTPDPGFSGDDTFSYTVVDSQGATTTASVTVSVAANQAPVTADDSYSALPGESVTLNVLANDSDPEGHALSIQSFDEPANGTVAEVPDVSESTWNYWLDSGQNYYSNFADWYNSYYGSTPLTYKYEYTPDAGFSGDDTFSYTVVDSQGATTTASVTVSVAPNQAPVTTDDSYSVLPGESVILNVLANDSDPEGHAISIQSFDDPANGTVAEVPDVSESTWNYWLDSGQNYYSNFADWYNSYYNYYGSTPLTYKYEYTPDAGFSGDDTFSYTVIDSQGATTTGMITVSVPVDEAPVLGADTISVAGGKTVSFDPLTNDSDPEGQQLSLVSVTDGAEGSARITRFIPETLRSEFENNSSGYASIDEYVNYNYGGWGEYFQYYGNPADDRLVVEYTSTNPAFNGTDSFTYTVQDAAGNVATGTVEVTVTPNQAPTLSADTTTVLAGDTVTVDVLANDSDPEGTPLQLVSVTGALAGVATIVRVIPESLQNEFNSQQQYGYYDSIDSFVGDYYGGWDYYYQTYYSGDPSLINKFVLQYESTDAGFSGTETLSYEVVDGDGVVATGTLSVEVQANQTPTANDDSYSVLPGESVVLNVLANDSDPEGHSLSIQSFDDPTNGTVAEVPDVSESTWDYWLNSGQNYYSNFADWYNSYYNYYDSSPLTYKYEYTPDAGFSGDDTFSYTVVDSLGATTTASVTVSVAANEVPTAETDTLIVEANSIGEIDPLANDSDAEGHALSLVSVSAATLGTASIIRFVPEGLQNEFDSHGEYTDVESYVIDTYGSWDNYFANYGNPEDNKYVIRFERSDPTVAGSETINYVVRDEHGGETTGTIDVVLLGDEPPTFELDSYTFSLSENVPVGTTVGTVSATDPDPAQTLSYALGAGNELRGFSIDQVTGEIKVLDPSIIDFETHPQFVLEVLATNSYGISGSAEIVVDLVDSYDPIALPDAVFQLSELSVAGASVGQVAVPQPNAGETYTYQILASAHSDLFAINSSTGELTVTDGATFDYETTPELTLSLRVDSSSGESAVSHVTVQLLDENEAPAVSHAEVAVPSGQAIEIALADLTTDPEGDQLELVSWTIPTAGTVYQASPNSLVLTYISAIGGFGTDEFTYTVRDSAGNESIGTVHISSTLIQSLGLAFGTETDSQWTTSDPLIDGVISGVPEPGPLLIEFDLDGDGVPDASQTIDVTDELDLIGFTQQLDGLNPGHQTIGVRSVIEDPTTGENLTPGWSVLSFELLPYQAPAVSTLYEGAGWVDYTGEEGGETSSQEDAPPNRLMGRLSGASQEVGFVRVEFDHDGDGVIDGETWTDAEGRFIYDPKSLDQGEATIRARSRVTNPADGEPAFGDWFEHTFQAQGVDIAGIESVALVNDLGGDQPTWTTHSPEIRGSVSSYFHGAIAFGLAPSSEYSEDIHYNSDSVATAGVMIEFDHDGDGVVDGRTTSDENGEFQYLATGILSGEVTLRLRTSTWSYAAGDYLNSEWSLVTFQLNEKPLLEPVISSFGLAEDNGTDETDQITSNPLLTGQIDVGEQAAGITLEFSHSGAGGVVDGTATVTETGTFHYVPAGIAFGQQTTRVRTLQWNPQTRQPVRGDWVTLNWTWTEDAGYVPILVSEDPSTPADEPSGEEEGSQEQLPEDHVAGDDAAATAYNTDVANAQANRDSAISTADNDYSAAIAQPLADYEAALSNAESTFESEIGSFTGDTSTFVVEPFAPVPPPPAITLPPNTTTPTPLTNSSFAWSFTNSPSDANNSVITGSTGNLGLENDPQFQQQAAQIAQARSNAQNASQQDQVDAIQQLNEAFVDAVNSASRTHSVKSAEAQAKLDAAIEAAENDSSVNAGNSSGQQQLNSQLTSLNQQINDVLDQLENLSIPYDYEDSYSDPDLQQAFIAAWQQREADYQNLDSQDIEYDDWIDGSQQIEQDYLDALKAAELAYRQASNQKSHENNEAYYDGREPLLIQLSELRSQLEKAEAAVQEASSIATAEFEHRKAVAKARAQAEYDTAIAALDRTLAEATAEAAAAWHSGVAAAQAAHAKAMAQAEVQFANDYNDVLESAIDAWANANPGPESQYQKDLFAAERAYVDQLNNDYKDRVAAAADASAAAATAVADADKTEAFAIAAAAESLTAATAQAEADKAIALASANKDLAITQATEAKTKEDALADALHDKNEALIKASVEASKQHSAARRDHADAVAQVDHDLRSGPTMWFYAWIDDGNGGGYSIEERGYYHQHETDHPDYQAAIQVAQDDFDEATSGVNAVYHAARVSAEMAWSATVDAAYRAEQEAITAASDTSSRARVAAEYDAEVAIQTAQASHDDAVAQAAQTAYQAGWDAGISLREREIDAAEQAAITQATAEQQKLVALADAADAYQRNVAQAEYDRLKAWNSTVNTPWSNYQLSLAGARLARLNTAGGSYGTGSGQLTSNGNGINATATLARAEASLTRSIASAQQQATFARSQLAAINTQHTTMQAAKTTLDASRRLFTKSAGAAAATKQKEHHEGTLTLRRDLNQTLIDSSSGLRNAVDATHFQAQGTIGQNENGTAVLNPPDPEFDANGAQDAAELGFTETVSRAQEANAHAKRNAQVAYENDLSALQRTWAQDVSTATSDYLTEVATARETYATSMGQLQKSYADTSRATSNTYYEATRDIYLAEQLDQQAADELAQQTIKEAWLTYQEEIAAEKATQLDDWVSTLTTSGDIAPEVGTYHAAVATADSAYTQAVNDAQRAYDQAVATADATRRDDTKTAEQTAYDALQTEWETVDAAFATWEADAYTQSQNAQAQYEKQRAQAEQERWLQDLTTRTSAEDSLRQQRANYDNAATTHYADWINDVADDQVSYLRSGGYNGWSQDQAYMDHMNTLGASNQARNTAVDGSLTSMVSGVGDALLSQATALGDNAVAHANGLNAAETSYRTAIDALPDRPNDLLVTQAQNETGIYATRDAAIQGFDEQYRLDEQAARAIYEAAIRNANATRDLAHKQALVDYQLTVAQNEADDATAQATSTGLAEDIQAAAEAAARLAYMQAYAPVSIAYQTAESTAENDYDAALDSADEQYGDAIAAAEAVRQQAIDAAWNQYSLTLLQSDLDYESAWESTQQTYRNTTGSAERSLRPILPLSRQASPLKWSDVASSLRPMPTTPSPWPKPTPIASPAN